MTWKVFFFFIWKKCAYDTGQNAKKRKLNSNSQLHIKKETKTQWNLHKSMALLSSLHRYFNIVQLITSFLYARVFYIIFIWNDFFCLFPMCCCLFEVWFSVYGHVHKYAYIFHTVRHVVRTHVHSFKIKNQNKPTQTNTANMNWWERQLDIFYAMISILHTENIALNFRCKFLAHFRMRKDCSPFILIDSYTFLLFVRMQKLLSDCFFWFITVTRSPFSCALTNQSN